MNKWNTIFLIVIVFLSISNCKNKSNKVKEKSSKKIDVDQRPLKSYEDNLKLICNLPFNDLKISKKNIKHIDLRLISIDNNILHHGSRLVYGFNSKNQVIQEKIYSIEGKLQDIIYFQFNKTNQLQKESYKSFDGGDPNQTNYFYNNLNQIIKRKDTSGYINSCYKYDIKNYLIQEKVYTDKDSLLKISNYSYDNYGNLTTILTKSNYNSIDTLSIELYKYNKLNQLIEHYYKGERTNCAGRNKWIFKYNEYGDIIEKKTHDLTVHNKYKYDRNKNWIKQYKYYNEEKSPNFLTTRKIEYNK